MKRILLVILAFVIVGCATKPEFDYKKYIELAAEDFSKDKYDEALDLINIMEYHATIENKTQNPEISYWKARILAAKNLSETEWEKLTIEDKTNIDYKMLNYVLETFRNYPSLVTLNIVYFLKQKFPDDERLKEAAIYTERQLGLK